MFDNNKKRGEYDKWTTVETDENESVSYKAKEPAPEPMTDFKESWFEKLQRVTNFMIGASITAGILLVGVLGHMGWDWFYGQDEFSEMRAKFIQNGHQVEADRLAEVGKVCRNGAETPLACQALYFKKETELAMMVGGVR